ncbi:Lrp/AsnC family transcriptional regulator [Sphingopyxis sp. XHP0097]|uniref:Lrp/AsnC family transcriptional regulator n=1 Tax=Sphingopyxis jiangsuensis TaxID=2871171 RepID=A0ABS7MGA5_9SPHN|nr:MULTISPECIES: Lrp/AsnC family transcriptional regulator [Sphingopyxis]MBL0768971.1 Lrp/AsnC family transcriptional regulator [Sphingopyxis lutea]MBY4637923.1 Lrp/AsnC family transcriptional regulator [Sphingopyxis jiangsuensis]
MIDRTDAKLLTILQREGPRPVAELGERVGLSPSACHRRVRALEAAGVIEGYAARLSPASIGLGLDVFVDISLTSQSEEALTAFESAVKSHDEILECQLLSGASDYRLRVAARNVADFDRLHRQCLSRLPGVAAMHSAFALRTIKAFEGYPVRPAERR